MKNKVLIISIVLIISFIVSITLFFMFNKKEIVVNTIEVVESFSKGDSSKAAKLVKQNIVKIVNTIDKDIKIYGTGPQGKVMKCVNANPKITAPITIIEIM